MHISLPSSGYLIDREIRFGDVSYRYLLTSGGQSRIGEALSELKADRFCVVVDSGVPDWIVKRSVGAFEAVAPVVLLRVEAKEGLKSVATLAELADAAVGSGITRRSCVVAVGGGLVGNVAGLLASLLFRGIRLVHVPTTLLAASDSTLSLKQAVNGGSVKNILGSYYAPELVWADLEVLGELPAEQVRAALCEAAKNVLAIVPDRFDEFLRIARREADYTASELAWIIDLCISAKTQVMSRDPKERGTGLVLEYGHTVGHGIELESGGAISHGPAIALGMLVAAEVSKSLGLLSEGDVRKHWEILSNVGVPCRIPDGISRSALMGRVRLDNKRGYLEPLSGVNMEMVVLQTLGRPVMTEGIPLTPVPHEVIEAGIEAVCR
ncbi:2-deoxy-scyllo-inosose synthase [Streptomyces atratus]|uniref:2-deoxy-scyllo-inosose synthase n=1 Tax=Streptomyces atratus TaxID=1893 RepID=A0A1K2F9V4_STRAR|nr:2-deoxy-scyllo-inosose synthase [Streptomyces atratus]SFY44507.1 3-dehydroquinate synthase [Streptomyces atratus]